MFKHILVPLDGSTLAEAALPAAALLAQKLGATVTLIHVMEQHAPQEIHGQPHLRDAKGATAYLTDVSQRCVPAGTHVDVHVHTAEVNDVATSIVEHAGELNHDLIVMCAHGRGHTLRLFLGSIAQKVVGMGSLPVLIIRPDDRGEVPPLSCTALLVPLDGGKDHEQALPVARALAQAYGAALHLAMVIPSFGTLSGALTVTSRLLPGTTSQMLELSAEEAEAYLAAQMETLKRDGFSGSAHVRRGDPAHAIADFAQELQVDAIVLATHGKTGTEAFWAGSVTHKVCSRCSLPLLLVPVVR
ncbi:MAG: universal stress protein [Planctomycetes bacterium]|nr:universal stress protein [Planctomycetota bacterium]